MLADEETELTIRQNLFLASVSLIEALGGGWDTNLLPTQKELEKDFSLVPAASAEGRRAFVWILRAIRQRR